MAYSKATEEGRTPPVRKPTREEVAIITQAQAKAERSGNKARNGRVDLDYLGVHSLVNELVVKYNQNNDVGIIRSWFRRNRVEAQDKHLTALSSFVGNVRRHASDLIEFKAQLMSQMEVLEYRITEIIEAAQFALDRQREEHQSFLIQKQAERKQILLELEKLQHSYDKLKWDAEKAKWEAEEIKQRARILELRGKLIEKIIQELQFADINMKQVFVLIEMIKESASDSDILGAEARWEQLKAEAKKTMAQADQEETESEWKKYKFEQDKKIPVD